MANIGDTSGEEQITLDDRLPFVESQDVPAGDGNTAAITITGPDDHVVAIDAATPVAPEFKDSQGEKLPASTQVTIQKCDKQGNPLGDGIIFNDTLGRFNYAKMRSDPEYMRKTKKSLMVDEKEIVKVFVEIPQGGNAFDAAQSRLTIGDDTSDFGKPVEIVDHGELSAAETQAVKAASQKASSNGGR